MCKNIFEYALKFNFFTECYKKCFLLTQYSIDVNYIEQLELLLFIYFMTYYRDLKIIFLKTILFIRSPNIPTTKLIKSLIFELSVSSIIDSTLGYIKYYFKSTTED